MDKDPFSMVSHAVDKIEDPHESLQCNLPWQQGATISPFIRFVYNNHEHERDW
jgi:hypothetical protein